MDLGIRGRVALVAGASAGIGLASARALAADGVRVAIVARRQRETEAAAAAIAADYGVEATAVIADLVRPGECERAVAETVAKFGTIDIVVPNCGGPPAGQFGDLDDDAWRAGFERTYLTTVRLIRASLPQMQSGSWGRIVTIGSVVTAEPKSELTVSSGLRVGLVALHRLLARNHAAEGITANLVSPGYTRTQRTVELLGRATEEETEKAMAAVAADIPTRRFAEAGEIGAVVAFLCSQPAAFVNGINLVVDGAQTRGI